MLDYIVVGLGLSGLAISEELLKRDKNFFVFENNSQSSSYVAGGIFNPVILKRFTPAWRAAEQMETALPFYHALQEKLGKNLIHYWDIYRRFHSVEEQNDWFVASDKPGLNPFLDSTLVKNTNSNLNAKHCFGRVQGTGNINTELLLDGYRQYLSEKNMLRISDFNYSELQMVDGKIQYQDVTASKIIFCEGFGLKKNPWFNYLPLQGNKGEYIIVKAEKLNLDHAIKASVFVMPLGNNLYKVGATYDNHDKTPETTEAARNKLINELKKLVLCDFEVVDQVAGIRPSVADRKPIVGVHPKWSNLYACNGFGSRGVLIAPNMAKSLLSFIEENKLLDPETDIARFTSKHFSAN